MFRPEYLALSVCKIDKDGIGGRLYENIPTFEEADLLAQLAMSEKEDNELIIIMPGWNRSIKRYPEEYERAKLLAEEYKIEVQCRQPESEIGSGVD